MCELGTIAMESIQGKDDRGKLLKYARMSEFRWCSSLPVAVLQNTVFVHVLPDGHQLEAVRMGAQVQIPSYFCLEYKKLELHARNHPVRPRSVGI